MLLEYLVDKIISDYFVFQSTLNKINYFILTHTTHEKREINLDPIRNHRSPTYPACRHAIYR